MNSHILLFHSIFILLNRFVDIFSFLISKLTTSIVLCIQYLSNKIRKWWFTLLWPVVSFLKKRCKIIFASITTMQTRKEGKMNWVISPWRRLHAPIFPNCAQLVADHQWASWWSTNEFLPIVLTGEKPFHGHCQSWLTLSQTTEVPKRPCRLFLSPTPHF